MSELEIIRHAKVGGISIFFDTVEYRTPHFHPEWELLWITEGTLSVNCGREYADCGKGELCLFAPKELHEFRRSDDTATFLCLQVSPQLFSYAAPYLAAVRPEAFRLTGQLPDEEAESVRQGMKRIMSAYLAGGPYFELTCVGECAALFARLLSALPLQRMSEGEIADADRRNERLSRFLSFVDANYAGKITLEEFAKSEHCSVSYMSRFLRRNLNQSFQDYVNAMRFHHACRLIAAGGKRMIDVCEESGFSDYRYFSGYFQKMCGMTPEEYRRKRPETAKAARTGSLHSVERFYTKQESVSLLRSL